MKTDALKDYITEYMETLETLQEKNEHLKTMQYFYDISKCWFEKNQRRTYKPQLVVLGPGVPEELLWAFGCAPFWVLGGSHSAVLWSDDMLPRDADPVHRSIMGFLYEEDGVDYSEALFLVPANCDSMRKMAYMLAQDGREVFPLDLPPDKTDLFAQEKWKMQIRKMAEVLEKHFKKKLTAKKILLADHLVCQAKKTLRRFLNLTEKQEQVISGSARLFIQNTYYYASDLKEWTEQLNRLIREIEGSPFYRRKTPEKPEVLLLGSPVYFPNYKIPFLIEDIGLSIYKNMDITALKLYDKPLVLEKKAWKEDVLDAVAKRFIQNDGSSAYAVNQTMLQTVEGELQNRKIDGVVYHILKGQIEYDFELFAFEELFENRGIPVFRLETDYQYQDVEQLRIRMEAFSEMLNQRRVAGKQRREVPMLDFLQKAKGLWESMNGQPSVNG